MLARRPIYGGLSEDWLGSPTVAPLLLAPHLDAAFDQGLITMADDGAIVPARCGMSKPAHCLALSTIYAFVALRTATATSLLLHRERGFSRLSMPSDELLGGALEQEQSVTKGRPR